MKVVKRKNKKKVIMLSTLSATLAVLTVLLIVLNSALLSTAAADGGTTPPELEDGEALYNNVAIAYPRVPEEKMVSILVQGKENNYFLKRDEEGATTDKDGKKIYPSFVLSYFDEEGIAHEYMPDILNPDSPSYDPTASYDDLYATISDDTFGMIPRITYLCTAIGTVYFDTRIHLPENDAEREHMLTRYGLNSENAIKIQFAYDDDKGVRKKHTITIGEPLITGVGYYFMVDDRNVVYSVETNNYFQYAMAGFVSFIKPTLTAAGLDMDSAFEPYLATDFKHYKNTIYDNDGTCVDGNGVVIPADVVGQKSDGSPIDLLNNGYKVVVNATTTVTTDKTSTGYFTDSLSDVEIDFNAKGGYAAYDRVLNLLMGKKVGQLSSAELLTLYTYNKLVDTTLKDLKYTYTITAIESILLDNEEIATVGTPLSEGGALKTNLIKVTYTAKLGGKSVSTNPMHAVLDLSAIPDDEANIDTKKYIKEAKIGTLDKAQSFTVDYGAKSADGKTYRNTVQSKIRLIVTDIITVVDSEDNNKSVALAADGTRVMYRFYIERDGVRLNGEYTDYIDMKAGLTGDEKAIYDALKGRGRSINLSLVIADYTQHTEIFADFITYEIEKIHCCVESEIVASFRFQQASNRDPFYGESLYENTLPENHKYRMYGLNASACEAVVKMLGGITGNSATTSEGLSGLQTVTIGITPELMREYGLYAYTVYFELPRGIKSIEKAEDVSVEEYLDSLDDYTSYGKLGFTLYISEIQTDGTRYIASDAYDVIAKIDASKMEFLEYGFADFYARRNLILTNVSNIGCMNMEFFMSDVYGSYKNELVHEYFWIYNGKTYNKSQLEKLGLTEEQLKTVTKRDIIKVIVTPDGECIETEFSKEIERLDAQSNNKVTSLGLYEFFDKETVEGDLRGTANYRELMELLFYTYYEGNLTEEEQALALDGAPLLMRMTVTLGTWNKDGVYQETSAFDYVYEFYRVSDRQILVKLYQQNRVNNDYIKAEVSDFYISTFSFKKIVNAYFGILNKIDIENDNPYEDSYIK